MKGDRFHSRMSGCLWDLAGNEHRYGGGTGQSEASSLGAAICHGIHPRAQVGRFIEGPFVVSAALRVQAYNHGG